MLKVVKKEGQAQAQQRREKREEMLSAGWVLGMLGVTGGCYCDWPACVRACAVSPCRLAHSRGAVHRPAGQAGRRAGGLTLYAA